QGALVLGLPTRPTLIGFGDGSLLHLGLGPGVLGFPVRSALLRLPHRPRSRVEFGAFVLGPPPRPPLFGFPGQALVVGLPPLPAFFGLASFAFRSGLLGALVLGVPARPAVVRFACASLLVVLRFGAFQRLQLDQPAISVFFGRRAVRCGRGAVPARRHAARERLDVVGDRQRRFVLAHRVLRLIHSLSG